MVCSALKPYTRAETLTGRVFIAWRKLSARTRDLAEALGAKVVLVRDRPPYVRAFFETYKIIDKLAPSTVIVQLPQGPLLYCAYRLKRKYDFILVADVHTAMTVHDSLRSILLNKPFVRYLRYADLVVVHNELLSKLLMEGCRLDPRKVLVVYDPPPKVPRLEEPSFASELDRFIVVPAAWAPDEPLEFIAREFCESKVSRRCDLLITGDHARSPRRSKIISKICSRILLTGFLPTEQYYWLITNAEAVIAATAREYTFLHSAWEALILRKPLLVSKTKTLEQILGSQYAGFFDLAPGSLRQLLDHLDVLLPTLRSCAAELASRLLKKQGAMVKKLQDVLNTLENRLKLQRSGI